MTETFETENIKQCSTSLESPAVFSKAKSWIEHCEKHHHSCGLPSNWLPTRLLDSGPLDSTDKVIVRLRETAFSAAATEESVIEGPYMTLSYCWGTEAPLTLTKHTHSNLSLGIPLNDLPKAFRDAICICRGVGVRYLWIDALCIFQDKDDTEEIFDWQQEASQMHKVYSNTLCNISAAAGVGSSSAILRPRAPDTLRQDELNIQWLNKDGTTTISSYRLVEHRLWMDDVVYAPVNRRAWVVQERMLSPRIIHFTNSRIYWECFEKIASEIKPQIWPCKVFPSKDNDKSEPISQDSLGKLYHDWCFLVELYAAKELTVRTDKLPGFSAIARRMATYFQDDYLAGMWRQSLKLDLLWTSRTPSESPQPAIYVG